MGRLHTDREYEAELHKLREKLLLMGAKTEEMIASSIRALVDRDSALARRLIGVDDSIDQLEVETDELCLRILARRQPVASDLRFLTTALKRDLVTPEETEAMVAQMAALNRSAMEAAREVGVNGSTDVTGYGLLGHLFEMAIASGVEAEIEAQAVPVLLRERVRELAEAEVVPGGSTKNLAFARSHTTFGGDVDEPSRVILADAQTSGGLLLSLPQERVGALVAALAARGTLAAAIIGRLRAGEPGRIHVVSARS